MPTHDDEKRRASNKNAAEHPVTLAKPEELLTDLALTLHNGLNNRRGRRLPCLLLGVPQCNNTEGLPLSACGAAIR